MFEFKDEFKTGIDFIDEEHRTLFELTQKTYDIFKDELLHDKYDYIVDVLNELRDYTKYHFNHEEEFMKEISYKKMFTHIMAHNNFIEKLDSYDFEDIDYNQTDTLVDILNFLYDWLVKHISRVDKEIALSLEEKE